MVISKNRPERIPQDMKRAAQEALDLGGFLGGVDHDTQSVDLEPNQLTECVKCIPRLGSITTAPGLVNTLPQITSSGTPIGVVAAKLYAGDVGYCMASDYTYVVMRTTTPAWDKQVFRYNGAGTVSAPGGAKVITGSGTYFQTRGEARAGEQIQVVGTASYWIASVDSDTQITTTANTAAFSGSTYNILGYNGSTSAYQQHSATRGRFFPYAGSGIYTYYRTLTFDWTYPVTRVGVYTGTTINAYRGLYTSSTYSYYAYGAASFKAYNFLFAPGYRSGFGSAVSGAMGAVLVSDYMATTFTGRAAMVKELSRDGWIWSGIPLKGEALVIYGDSGIWAALPTNSLPPFEFRQLSTTIGIANPDGVCSFDKGHFFVGKDDCYVFDGSEFYPVGHQVGRHLYSALTAGYSTSINVTPCLPIPSMGLIMVLYSEVGGTTTEALFFDYKNQRWYGPSTLDSSWDVKDVENIPTTSSSVVASDGFVSVPAVITNTGYIYELDIDGLPETGWDTSAYIVTKDFTFDPTKYERITHMELLVKYGGSGSPTIAVSYSVDQGSNYTALKTLTGTGGGDLRSLSTITREHVEIDLHTGPNDLVRFKFAFSNHPIQIVKCILYLKSVEQVQHN